MSSERKEPTVSSLSSKEQLAERGAAGSRQPPRRPSDTSSSSRNSASSGFVWFVLLITLLAVGIAGYTAWQLGLSQAVIEEQRLRIVQLEKKLTISDDSANQSLASVGAKVRELDERSTIAMSEVDKLWATRNVNRKSIADNVAAIESLQASQSKVAALEKKLNQTAATVTPLKSSLASATQSLTDQELLLQSLRERVKNQGVALEAVSEQAKAGVSASAKVNAIDSRLKETEGAIESLEAFRRTVNRDLIQLKQGTTPTAKKP